MEIKLKVKPKASEEDIRDCMVKFVGMLPTQWHYDTITEAFNYAVARWKEVESKHFPYSGKRP